MGEVTPAAATHDDSALSADEGLGPMERLTVWRFGTAEGADEAATKLEDMTGAP
jgi:hypothetical protein